MLLWSGFARALHKYVGLPHCCDSAMYVHVYETVVHVCLCIGRLPMIAHCVPIVHYKVVVMDGVSKVTV